MARALRSVVKRVRRSSGRRSLVGGKRKSVSQDETSRKTPHISPTRSLPKGQDADIGRTGRKRKSSLEDGNSRRKSGFCVDERSPAKPAQGPPEDTSVSVGIQPAVEAPKPLPNFMAGIPLAAHELTPTVRDMVAWIHGGAGTLAVLAAGPALGSSSAVRKAAELAGALYVRVPGGSANLRIGKMLSDCIETVVHVTDAGPAQVDEVEAALQSITDAAVAGLLRDLREKLDDFREEGPGANVNLIWMAEEDEAGGPAVDLGVLGKVVVHVDEVGESLGVSHEKTAKGSDKAKRGDWQMYTSCAFGRSLAATCSEVPNLRVALSVRLSSQVHKLVLPPCVPQAYISPVCAAAPEQVEPVLRRYLVGRVNETSLQGLSKDLAGPFRLMQKFLTEVEIRAEQPLTAGVLKECLDTSYAHLRVELLAQWKLQCQDSEGLLNAMRTLRKEAGCTRLSTEISKHLSGILACGLLSLKVLPDGNFIEVVEPSPFIKYILDNS